MNALFRAGMEALKNVGNMRTFATSASLPDRKVVVLGAAGATIYVSIDCWTALLRSSFAILRSHLNPSLSPDHWVLVSAAPPLFTRHFHTSTFTPFHLLSKPKKCVWANIGNR